jgi:hypothetical protein
MYSATTLSTAKKGGRHLPNLTRAQVFAVADALNADPSIELIEITETKDGKVRVSSVAMKPVTKPIRVTKQNGKKESTN